MSEVQKHGFEFENQIKSFQIEKILNCISISYTNNWDVPPMSVKSFKITNINGLEQKSLEFGDAKRFIANEITYILIIIGYKQDKEQKIPLLSDVLYICPQKLEKIISPINLD